MAKGRSGSNEFGTWNQNAICAAIKKGDHKGHPFLFLVW